MLLIPETQPDGNESLMKCFHPYGLALFLFCEIHHLAVESCWQPIDVNENDLSRKPLQVAPYAICAWFPMSILFHTNMFILMTIGAIGTVLLSGSNLSSRPDGVGELFENVDRGVPIDAGVGDADALLERSQTTFGGDLLVALVDVGFDHDGNDGVFARSELIPDSLGNQGLVLVVLLGVAVGAINHHDFPLALFP